MNTLTKKIVKRALSAFLSVLIVCSLFTVGFTSASAADVEVAPTGADTVTVYFQNNWKWSDVKIYCWDSSKNALAGAWPGTEMDFHKNDGTYDVYKYTLPANTAGFIFNGINMVRIESRPIPEKPFTYRFFVDFEGNLSDASVKNALNGIRAEVSALKILGNY